MSAVLLFTPYTPCMRCRVVNISSISEQLGLFALYTPSIPYDDIPGYNLGDDSGEKPYVMAKTHILMATSRELAKRLEGTGVDVIAGETAASEIGPASEKYSMCRLHVHCSCGHRGWNGSWVDEGGLRGTRRRYGVSLLSTFNCGSMSITGRSDVLWNHTLCASPALLSCI